MKRFLPVCLAAVIIGASIAVGRFREYTNPDPNHTHADFAVWVEGQQLDFSGDQFMSEVYVEGRETRIDPLRKYLHLHDGNGHIIHRHKPGLTLGDFMRSLGVKDTTDGLNLCLEFPQSGNVCGDEAAHSTWIMKTEDEGYMSLDFNYVFEDEEAILIMLPSSGEFEAQEEEIAHAWNKITSDACLYSKTCPWKGDPPTENCIADPTVPCVIPD